MKPMWKIKGDDYYDYYQCKECGQVWKSYYKRIGHKSCPKK